jgi:hypothetical protein
MGMSKGVDVLVEDDIKLQCKKKKKFPQWMIVEEGVDYQVVQTDYQKPMVIMPLEQYFETLLLVKEMKERYR